VLFDKAQVILRLELLHDDQRGTDARERHAPAQRRGVVERGRGEVDRPLIGAREGPGDLDQRIVGVDRQAAFQRRADAFRAAGRAG